VKPMLVVMPTYNERANLEKVVAGILAHDFTRVLIVDDASPDGTGQLADTRTPHVSR
jgi:dolichol-phosphate mannosyltransferase